MNSNFPAWWLYPVAGPRLLLGLFSICLSKACRGPIFARSESQWGKHSQQEDDERESELCRQGGSQQEGALLEG